MSTPRRSSRVVPQKKKATTTAPLQSQTTPRQQPRNKKPKSSLALLSPEQSQRRKAVEEFFRSAPHPLKPVEGVRLSRSTRPPHFFDMHLHHDLILHHVVKVRSITSDLLTIAGEALDSCTNLPPISENFPRKKQRNNVFLLYKDQKFKHETDIRDVYDELIYNICHPVAATLAYQLPEWSTDGLLWTKSNGSQRENVILSNTDGAGQSSSVANADGILRISVPNEHPMAAEVAKEFRVVGVWEFKNMGAGDEITLRGILNNFSTCERFPWEGCPKEDCLSEHRTMRRRMGFDAEKPICPSIKSATESVMKQRASNPNPRLPNPKEYTACPRHILQQVWAEAVERDATFIVINSGNLELIGIRDRENQTLYLSDIIKVPDCHYFKLHTGLAIAGIRDAVARTSLIREKRPLPASWTFGDPLTEEIIFERVEQSVQSRVFLTASWINEKRRVIFIPKSGYRRVGSDSEPAQRSEDDLLRIRLKEATVGNPIVKGYLRIPGVPSDDIPVIVKIAPDEISAQKLRHEYAIQDQLGKQVKGVVGTIGLFEYRTRSQDDPEILQAALLVMEGAGETVAELRRKNDGKDFLSREQLNEYRRILGAIHAAEYTHRNLTLEALWVQGECNSAVVAIGEFGGAIHQSTEPRAHGKEVDKDLQKLLELVPNLLLHGKDDEEPQTRSASRPPQELRPPKRSRLDN